MITEFHFEVMTKVWKQGWKLYTVRMPLNYTLTMVRMANVTYIL